MHAAHDLLGRALEDVQAMVGHCVTALMASAEQVDQRADGGWHAEWDTLRTLLRRTLTAGSQVTDLVTELVVDPARMRATLDAAHDDVHAEQRSLAQLAGHATEGDYLGAAGSLVETAIARAQALLKENA